MLDPKDSLIGGRFFGPVPVRISERAPNFSRVEEKDKSEVQQYSVQRNLTPVGSTHLTTKHTQTRPQNGSATQVAGVC